jgi:hypothetical protein
MNMTIKTQAFLQGYLHEKTAADPGPDQLPVKPWVTPIVAAPGIPQTAPDPGVKPLFPDGKARFKRTQLQMPPKGRTAGPGSTRYAYGREFVTPASVNNQYLTRVLGGAAALVAEQKDNFERDRVSTDLRVPLTEKQRAKREVLPRNDLISFDKRNQPVLLDTKDKSYFPYDEIGTYPEEQRIVGLDPEKLRKLPEGRWVSSVQRQGESKPYRDYYGFPEAPDGGSAGRPDNENMSNLSHELTHNYTGGRGPEDYVERFGDDEFPPGTSYITDRGSEYTQGATAGLNAMRDITGEKLNDPQQVHQLFDEIIAKPSILDSISIQNARVFRTYLTLRETNPKRAEKLRESMARDSQYLVKNELQFRARV